MSHSSDMTEPLIFPPSISERLPRYTQYTPLIPVWCVTPNTPRTIHRFFDSSPFSPSGRYVASTQLPYEDYLPAPGDVARVVVTDLVNGDEQCVAETKGWDTQLGAQVHWGADDRQLLFNDVDVATWTPHAVRLDLDTGQRTSFQGPIYAVSRDRRFAVCPCLRRTGIVQAGYGVIVPPEFVPKTQDASDEDGIFLTDLTTGTHRLLVSIRQMVESAEIPFQRNAGQFVAFQLALNPQADHILFILRWLHVPPARRKLLLDMWRQVARIGRKAAGLLHQRWLQTIFQAPQMVFNNLLVVRSDGTEPRVILPAEDYAKGGHHPSWCPDGRSILMNRRIDGQMRFACYHLDSDRWEIRSDRIVGSGHPTLHPNGHHIVTDAYYFEPVAFGDGTAPIRLIDWAVGNERTLVRIRTQPKFTGPRLELRVDPHPAWNDSFTRLAFNAYVDGTRRVYVADLTDLNLAAGPPLAR